MHKADPRRSPDGLYDPLDGPLEAVGQRDDEQLYLLPAYWRSRVRQCSVCGLELCDIEPRPGVKIALDVAYAYRKKDVKGCRTTRVHSH